MRQTRTKQSVSEKLAQQIMNALFAGSGGGEIPGLIAGTENQRCSKCYFFRIDRGSLRKMDAGHSVIGVCESWGGHTSSDKQCPRYVEGEPDAR